MLIGENGTGKTNLLDAISYFYYNLTGSNISTEIFDENNHYSNEVRISLTYDLSEFVKISKSNTEEIPDFGEEEPAEKSRYSGYYKAIISMASKVSNKKLRVELSQVKGRSIRWNCTYEERLIFKSLCLYVFSLELVPLHKLLYLASDLHRLSGQMCHNLDKIAYHLEVPYYKLGSISYKPPQ